MKTGNAIALVLGLLLSACNAGGSGGVEIGDDPDVLPRNDVRERAALYPYRSDSLYADVLKKCALIESSDDGCTLQTLPFIGQSGNTVTHTDVMSRLLVTHDWMGQRFETLLRQAPDDMLRLFASVTVISIGSTVRPSNYWTGTGGIQLDPRHLWLSLEEKANVATEDDYRSGFGRELNFWSMQALRINGEQAYPRYSLTSYAERPLEDIRIRVYSLLYHELGHAVDYVQPELMSLVDTRLNPAAAIDGLSPNRSSLLLANELPLQSVSMSYLALVQFRGYEATEQQKAYTPSQVGSFMSIDGAMKYYSYHTEREDFSNLLESTMMKKNFDVDLLVGYVTKPFDENSFGCADLRVGWGQHNRLSDPMVLPRARWVLDRVYGSSEENEAYFDSLDGLKREMAVGVDWCTNRDGESTARSRQNVSPVPDRGLGTRIEQLQSERRHGHHLER